MTGASRFDALVLAGTRSASDPVAVAGGKNCKAFVEVAGRPMIERVIEALEHSGHAARIAVCLAPDLPPAEISPGVARALAEGRLVRVAAASTPVQSVARALKDLPSGRPLLITTADHPLLTPATVAAFADAALAGHADVAVAVAPTDLIEATYSSARRTRLRFRDGRYSGCNLFALMGRDACRVLRYWRRMEAHRKHPWRMALALGPVTLAAYAFGRLSLHDALARIARRARTNVQAIVLDSAEAAIDVDTLDDLRLAERILRARGGGE